MTKAKLICFAMLGLTSALYSCSRGIEDGLQSVAIKPDRIYGSYAQYESFINDNKLTNQGE